MAHLPEIDHIMAVFLRLETRKGDSAWGCAVAGPPLADTATVDQLADVNRVCQDCASLVPDLHPLAIEYSLARLAPLAEAAPSALCAFDLAFHDLLGLATGMPLYRLLGGYRQRIQTSVTVPIAPVADSVEMAQAHARVGFRMLKVKGGLDPEQGVRRVQASAPALP